MNVSHVWSVACLSDKLDVLLAQLAELDGARLVIVRTPGKKRLKVEYYSKTRREADALQRKYGGNVRQLDDAWKMVSPPRKPILIRDRFRVVEAASRPLDPKEIVIPAGLAFGTGDHPTTASCLRLLCDVRKKLTTEWSFLDIGTGSGVLAIAARKLGARPASAFDYDPRSIATARKNARLNQIQRIQWTRQDLLTFVPSNRYRVVAANIFSELFLAAWPRIHRAIGPEGYFILSGILRFQADDCRKALEKSKFVMVREVRLGKWVTILAQNSPVNFASHID